MLLLFNSFVVVLQYPEDSLLCSEDYREGSDCRLGCRVKPATNIKLSIPPRVKWEREVSAGNKTYLSLGDRYWYKTAKIDFHYYGEKRCTLAVDSDNIVYYNCDFVIPRCSDGTYFLTEGYFDTAVAYRCVVTVSHSDEVPEVSMCTRPGE